MKRFTGLSLAAALGSALLMSVVLPGAARASSFGAVAGVVENAAPLAVEAQFRGARVGRVGGGGARVGRVGGGMGRVGPGRVGGGRWASGGYRGGRGYYRGGRGAGVAAGVLGAALLGGIIADQAYGDSYYYGGDPYYGGPVYAPAPVYQEEIYVAPRRYNRGYNRLPRNAVRDPAGGGLTSGGP